MPVARGQGRLAAAVRRAFEGTPGRMRFLGALAAALAAIFGLVGANTLWSSSAALERANHNTSQVVRVQSIYTDLVRADADATNSFLVGGLENPSQRADYEASMGRASATLADAAQSQPADGKALGVLNQQIQAYTALVEQDRVYNRQGMPVGAQYLKSASTGLRGQALPVIDAITKADTDRALAELDQSSSGVPLWLTGTLALVVLVLVMLWLARRTHRYLNGPLTAGTLGVLVALLLGAVVLSGLGAQTTTVRTNAFQGTLAVTTARSAAYDAKSNESLALIARGQGQPFEKTWQLQAQNVRNQLETLRGVRVSGLPAGTGPDLLSRWDRYARTHAEIRALDDGGNWDGAVAKAADLAPTSANATFAAFDAASATALETLRAATAEQVLEPRARTVLLGWVLLALCLGSALLVTRGISARLEEYR